jgi:hypothetical protein
VGRWVALVDASHEPTAETNLKKNAKKETKQAGILAGVAKGDEVLVKDIKSGREPLANGREEVLKVTRVTETKVHVGSRGFFKTTGLEEGLPDGVEVQASPATITKKATKTKPPRKVPIGAKDGTKKREGLSQLDAAAKVLGAGGAKREMNCQDLVKEMVEKVYWDSPGGKTPHATLHAAISREIKVKGKDSRFKKAGRGLFALAE